MRKNSLVPAILISALLVSAGCRKSVESPSSTATASTATTVTATTSQPFDIAMVSFAGYAPLYVAKEKGFFGDLNVQLHRIEDIASIRAGVTKKDLEAYLATPDIALDNNTRAPGKAVWAIDESAGADGVVVSGAIKTVADLRGKKVAAEPGLPPYFVLSYVLHENGMSRNDVKIQDLTTQNAAAAFVSGSVDAAAIYEPYLSQARGQRRESRILLSSKDTPGLIVDLIFVRDDALTTRATDVDKVIKGWNQALAYIATHRSESFAIMAKAFNLPIADFEGIASGIRWLGPAENKHLIGTATAPGPLFERIDTVVAVLRRNRPAVFAMPSRECLTSDFVTRIANGQ